MPENYKILGKKNGDFRGEDGDTVSGFWIKAKGKDGVAKEFWVDAKTAEAFVEGGEKELELEKVERRNGKIGYKYVKPRA